METHTYIGYSTDMDIRRQSTSGGVGSAIVKYLLDTGKANYALSFDYNQKHVCYSPKLITSFSEYSVCGSIYQEMNLVKELKVLLSDKVGGELLFSHYHARQRQSGRFVLTEDLIQLLLA